MKQLLEWKERQSWRKKWRSIVGAPKAKPGVTEIMSSKAFKKAALDREIARLYFGLRMSVKDIAAKANCTEEIKQAGLKYLNNGLSVLPLNGKRPLIKWTALKETPLTTKEWVKICDERKPTALGLICSKGVTGLDFDDREVYEKWLSTLGAKNIEPLPLQETGQGYHIAFKLATPRSKGVLAARPHKDYPIGGKPLIETCGYILVSPSNHINKEGVYDRQYKATRGNFYDLPQITEEAYIRLEDEAKNLNEMPKNTVPSYVDSSTSFSNPTVDIFNGKNEIAKTLIKYNYEPDPHDNTKFRAPMSQSGLYGVNILDDGKFFSWHASDPLHGNVGIANGNFKKVKYSAFDLYRVYEHDGDWGSALRRVEEEYNLGFKFSSKDDNEDTDFKRIRQTY